MKFAKKSLVSLLVVGVLLVSGMAYAVSAAAPVKSQAAISVEQVRAIVQGAYPDYTFGEIELENDTGTPVYDVEATDKNGIPYDIEVDPTNGTILQIQIDEDYSATGVIVEENDDD